MLRQFSASYLPCFCWESGYGHVLLFGSCHRVYLVSLRNSSLVSPASEIISISSPRFIVSCFGTGTAMSSFTSMMWLPLVRAALYPALASALTT